MSEKREKKNVAQVLVEQLTKISTALDTIKDTGIPESLIIYYVQKKTRLPKRDIEAVFDALRDFKKEITIPVE